MNKLFLLFAMAALTACQNSNSNSTQAKDFTTDAVGGFSEQHKAATDAERQQIWASNYTFGCVQAGSSAAKYEIDPALVAGAKYADSNEFSIPGFNYSINAQISVTSPSPFVRHMTRTTSAGNDSYDYTCDVPDQNANSRCHESNTVRDDDVTVARAKVTAAGCRVISTDRQTFYSLSQGTFTMPTSGKTVRALETEYVKFGTIKCGDETVLGSWRGIAILSNDVVPVGYFYCGGVTVYDAVTYADSSGNVLFSSRYKLTDDALR